jgi:hypothetical protein
MSTWDVALIREQGIEFGVVAVQDHVVNNSVERDKLIRAWSTELARPVVLIGAQRHQAYGRRDIVNWLSVVSPSQLPWRRLTIN